MKYIVDKAVFLKPNHLPGRGTQSISDAQGKRSFEPFIALQVARHDGDCGYYLFRFTEDGAVADTWHETVEDAFQQAAFEFDVKPEEWTDVVH